MGDLEQFCLLAKAQKGRALAALLQQVVGHKNIFVFGELLELASVKELKSSEFATAYNTLELFAYGTYADFKATPSKFIELTAQQLFKLRQLSLVSVVANQKVVPYEDLQRAVGIEDLRAFEDLIIESIYAGLFQGRLFQKERLLKVSSAISRDVNMETDVPAMLEKLNKWRASFVGIVEAVQASSAKMASERKESEDHQLALQAQVEIRTKQIKDNIEAGLDPLDGTGSFAETRTPMSPSATSVIGNATCGRASVQYGSNMSRYGGNKQPRRHVGPAATGGGTGRMV